MIRVHKADERAVDRWLALVLHPREVVHESHALLPSPIVRHHDDSAERNLLCPHPQLQVIAIDAPETTTRQQRGYSHLQPSERGDVGVVNIVYIAMQQ